MSDAPALMHVCATKIITLLLVLPLVGCASAPPAESYGSLSTEGCRPVGLPEVLLWPEDVGVQLHPTDVLIGRVPDIGDDPGFLVHFRQGRTSVFAQAVEPPKILMAVGSWNNSCSILVDHATCPAAAAIYNDLASRSIPIGHAFDDPIMPTVLHGTRYFLSSRDGHGNPTDWSYVGIGHPLQDVLNDALDNLALCAVPAVRAFQQQYPARTGQHTIQQGHR
ncbi:hypothetical protein [Pseudoxanthomonas japonensis]|uniref:hypothetical protein n=1 Tax=Pseudoxanthomonas japonensis TaxID=69284 RepID=UPI003748AD0E